MGDFWKAAALALLTAVLGLAVGKGDVRALLGMAGCCILAVVAMTYLEPVLELLWELEALAQLDDGLLGTLLKAVGVTLVSELAGMLCADAGEASLGRTLQLLGSGVVLYLSIPVVRLFLELVRSILGGV